MPTSYYALVQVAPNGVAVSSVPSGISVASLRISCLLLTSISEGQHHHVSEAVSFLCQSLASQQTSIEAKHFPYYHRETRGWADLPQNSLLITNKCATFERPKNIMFLWLSGVIWLLTMNPESQFRYSIF